MYTQCRSYPLYLDHAWQTVEYTYPGSVAYQIVGILYTNTCILVYLVLLDIQHVYASIWFIPYVVSD